MYKKLALTRKTFKNKKKESFKNFAQRINFSTNSKYIWDTLKILKNKWTKLPENYQCHTNNEDKLAIALEKICPPWVPENPDCLPCTTHNEFLSNTFTFAEFYIDLEIRKTNPSPGRAGIDYHILQTMPIKYKLLLADIFNEMYNTKGVFPKDWCNSFVHFIKKSDGVNYRPISLTSCTCKLFDIIIKNRLDWRLDTNNLLPKIQSGFRKGQLCTDNIVNLTGHIEEAFRSK